MNLDIGKFKIALSATWLFLCLPIAQHLYDSFYSGFFLRIFSYFLVASPVVVFYGWKWLSDQNIIPKKIISIYGLICLGAFLFIMDSYEDETFYMPISCFLVLLFLKFFENQYPKIPQINLKRPLWLNAKNSIIAFILFIFSASSYNFYISEKEKRAQEQYAAYIAQEELEYKKQFEPYNYTGTQKNEALNFYEAESPLKKGAFTDLQKSDYLNEIQGKVIKGSGYVTEVKNIQKECLNPFDRYDREPCGLNLYKVSLDIPNLDGETDQYFKVRKTLSFETSNPEVSLLNKGEKVFFVGFLKKITVIEYANSSYIELSSVQFEKVN